MKYRRGRTDTKIGKWLQMKDCNIDQDRGQGFPLFLNPPHFCKAIARAKTVLLNTHAKDGVPDGLQVGEASEPSDFLCDFGGGSGKGIKSCSLLEFTRERGVGATGESFTNPAKKDLKANIWDNSKDTHLGVLLGEDCSDGFKTIALIVSIMSVTNMNYTLKIHWELELEVPLCLEPANCDVTKNHSIWPVALVGLEQRQFPFPPIVFCEEQEQFQKAIQKTGTPEILSHCREPCFLPPAWPGVLQREHTESPKAGVCMRCAQRRGCSERIDTVECGSGAGGNDDKYPSVNSNQELEEVKEISCGLRSRRDAWLAGLEEERSLSMLLPACPSTLHAAWSHDLPVIIAFQYILRIDFEKEVNLDFHKLNGQSQLSSFTFTKEISHGKASLRNKKGREESSCTLYTSAVWATKSVPCPHGKIWTALDRETESWLNVPSPRSHVLTEPKVNGQNLGQDKYKFYGMVPWKHKLDREEERGVSPQSLSPSNDSPRGSSTFTPMMPTLHSPKFTELTG
ncbi:hypothetical protein GH733_014884 [Mirounga leonina]|nr:hypothetical protein GH733_014884 [Mirounga leonina]